MPIEIYYFNKSQKDLSKSTINYTQVNYGTTYNSYSNMEQATLYEELSGKKSGKWYSTYFVQEDSSDQSYNKCFIGTLSLQHGILVFSGDSNTSTVSVGDITYYKPTYQSGIYKDKNIKIIEEVIQGTIDILYKLIIIY
jgi:transcription initiation factor IIF auxiliary subunit